MRGQGATRDKGLAQIALTLGRIQFRLRRSRADPAQQRQAGQLQRAA